MLAPSSPQRWPAMTALAATFASPSIQDVVAHRDWLLRFARRRLRDAALAEDAVHDVFEAVLAGRARYGGRAALRSWLAAVLKNKLVDIVRAAPMHVSLDDGADDDDGHESGALQVASSEAGPEARCEQRERLAQTLRAIEALPPHLRDAIEARALDDLDATTCCAQLGITPENLFVRVHRARQRLLA